MLATLVIDVGRVVPVDRLVGILWDKPPLTADKQIRNCAAHLRRCLTEGGLSPDLVVTDGPGYRLLVEQNEVDAAVFVRLVEASRRLGAHGRLDAAGKLCDEALMLWRGPALAGLSGWILQAAAARLEEQRISVVEDHAAYRLLLGRQAEVVSDLIGWVEEQPPRERLVGLLMRALYQAGRQSEALRTYQVLRARLADELGVDPSREIQQLHTAILRGDPALHCEEIEPSALAQTISRPLTPAQLPSAVPDFVGRATQLERLDALLAHEPDRGPPPSAVVVMTGGPGVGKTTLAVRWAHRVRDQFADGQLYVNLRGYAYDRPLSPIEAVALLLRALGVAPAQVPVELDAAVGLYRTLLAGRRVLVLLDNARDAEQVRPLLPGEPGCLALVTSRDRLTGLVARDGARRLVLDPLTPSDSRALLTRRLNDVESDGSTIGDLAVACGHLPLALCIAAAHLADRPGADVAGYVASLRGDHALAGLEIDGDPASSVRAAFGLSYLALTSAARRLFRRLGLIPGPDITASSAAALVDVDAADAGRLLDALARAHLITPTQPGRYELHDLLRRYARERAHAEEDAAQRSAAVARLNNHYLYTVDAAAKLLYPHIARLDIDVPEHATVFVDEPAAVSWVDAELANLVAAADHASSHEPNAAAWLLASALSGYFWLRRRYATQWLSTGAAGLVAATIRADQPGLAGAHLNLGLANRCLGRYTAAVEHTTVALSLSRQLGWRRGEAAALNQLGWIHTELGDHARALTHLDEAVAVNRRMADRVGEASVLSARSGVLFRMGELPGSVHDGLAALDIDREVHNPVRAASAHINVALSQAFLGQCDAALDNVTRSLELFEQVGERYGQNLANVLRAKIHLDAGRYPVALELVTATLEQTEETADHRNMALALADRVEILRNLGHTEHAVRDCTYSVELSRSTDYRWGEVRTLIGLAEAYLYDGLTDQALAHAADARALADRYGFRMLEGLALTVAGETHLAAGDPVAAAKHAADALHIHHQTGYRLGAARAHTTLGHSVDNAAAPTHRQATRRS